MGDLTIRPATPDDHAVLLRFVTSMAGESDRVELDADVVGAGLREALADPAHRQYYLGLVDGEPVACCLITTEWSDWTGRWYWWFQSVYVVPDRRGPEQAVWDRMYAWIRDRARAAGVQKLLLYTHEDNVRAHRAYQRVGMRRPKQRIYEAPTAAPATVPPPR